LWKPEKWTGRAGISYVWFQGKPSVQKESEQPSRWLVDDNTGSKMFDVFSFASSFSKLRFRTGRISKAEVLD
jgi:hypothetical protein